MLPIPGCALRGVSWSISHLQDLEGDSPMDVSQGLEVFLYGVLVLFAVGTILSRLFQVRTAQAVVIQRMGKFLRVANAGINFKLPWLDQIAGRIDLRVQQLAL